MLRYRHANSTTNKKGGDGSGGRERKLTKSYLGQGRRE